MKPIVVIGDGGHGKVIQDIIFVGKLYKVFAVLDDKYNRAIKENNIIFGPISLAKELIKDGGVEFVIAIGNNIIRKKVADNLTKMGAKFATLIHPSASVSPFARIDEGTTIMAGGVINADAIIGKHVIINSLALIEHENEIGDYVHISPGAVLTGNVKIGGGSHVGANATIIPGKNIGEWTTIGAGSTVTKDLPNEVTAIGSPARIKL